MAEVRKESIANQKRALLIPEGYQNTLDLRQTEQAIKELEGREDKNLDEYARFGTEKNLAMVEEIRKRLKLTTLKFQKLDDLVSAIGLPKERLCTHCWDGSSYF